MLKRYFVQSCLSIFLGVACLSLASGYSADFSSSSRNYYESRRTGVSDETTSQYPKRQATGREEMAYEYSRDEDNPKRTYRLGDWDYQQNWRYDRRAFYKGASQPQAFREEHPFGPAGIGYDADYDDRYRSNNRNGSNDSYGQGYDYNNGSISDNSEYDRSRRGADRSRRGAERYRNSNSSYDRSYDRYNYQDRSRNYDRQGYRTDSNRNNR